MSELYLKDFDSFAGAATADGSDSSTFWLESIRRAAMERFARTGFPSSKEEEWPFTPVTPIAQASWSPAWARESVQAPAVSRDQLTPFVSGHAEGSTLVFINGEYAPEVSSLDSSTAAGVVVTSLAEALRTGGPGGELLERHLAPVTGSKADVVGLGCTHYPFLRSRIKRMLGGS